MKPAYLRILVSILLLCALALLISSPALAEIVPIPLDMKAHGAPAREEGWISENEYKDESIHVVYETRRWKAKSSKEETICRWIRVKIADPSQLRTTMSNESYDDPSLARSVTMARSVNAVVACNGDFMKYNYNKGYVLRQGVFYRDALDGSRDVLVIDEKGNFSSVSKATSEAMAAKIQQMELEGHTPINVFCFGPTLVLNGVAQDTDFPEMESHIAAQRMAILQVGELEYVMLEVDGGNGTGMNLQELANFVVRFFPECKVAYNLDGGGSTHMMLNGKLVHRTANSRTISDIIYFASAVAED